MKTLFLQVILLAGIIFQNSRQEFIETQPSLPSRVIATNLMDLELLSTISINQTFIRCSWVYNEKPTTTFESLFFNNDVQEVCMNFTDMKQRFQSYCSGNTSTASDIFTAIRLLKMIENNMTYQITCSGQAITDILYQDSISLFTADCKWTNRPAFLRVESKAATYNSTGYFKCDSGTTLFRNGHKVDPGDETTTCLATAEWSGIDQNLTCWRAPTSIRIFGNLNVLENQTVSLACNYTLPIHPQQKVEITFMIDMIDVPEDQVEMGVYNTTVSRLDNRKLVQCRVSHPLINESSTEGVSPANTAFDIHYPPYRIDKNIIVCNDTCSFLFRSNPHAKKALISDSGNKSISVAPLLLDENEDEHEVVFNTNNFEISLEQKTIFSVWITQSSFNESLLYQVCLNGSSACQDAFTTTTSTFEPPQTTSNEPINVVIIVVSCLGGIIAVFVVVIAILYWRRRCERSLAKEGGQNEVVNSPIYESSDGLGLKEVRQNQLYVSLEQAPNKSTLNDDNVGTFNIVNNDATSSSNIDTMYGAVDPKRKKKKQKSNASSARVSDGVNVGTSTSDNVNATYGVVDPTRKKKKQ